MLKINKKLLLPSHKMTLNIKHLFSKRCSFGHQVVLNIKHILEVLMFSATE